MEHGRNNPTGNIGFSPLLITLFAPFAFVLADLREFLLLYAGILFSLLIWGFICHGRDLRHARKERLERDARGF